MVVCETYISSLFSVIYINLNITSPSRAESDATTTTDDARADVYGPTPTRGPDDYLRTVLVARGSDVDGSQPNAGCGYRTAGGGRRPGEPRPRLGTARGPLGHVLPRLRVPRRRRRVLRHLGAVPRRLHRGGRLVDHDGLAHRAALGGRARPDLRLLSPTFQTAAATRPAASLPPRGSSAPTTWRPLRSRTGS